MNDRAQLSTDLVREVFAQARGADIESVAGVKLFRSGRRLRGECPLCGASKGKRADGAFSVEPQAGWFKCWGCGEGGDVVDLERALRGGSLLDAALRLADAPAPVARPVDRSQPARRKAGPERMARMLFADAEVEHPLALRYLSRRGITPPPKIGRELRLNPRAMWGYDDRGAPLFFPAMVAAVWTPAGFVGGVHATYLAPDGSKAHIKPAKKMWGPQRDVDGRPGGVWLTDPRGPGPLIVGEGIESTLAAMDLWSRDHDGAPCRGVATLSLGALQGGWKTDAYGRIDPACVAGDPEKPAFTWPEDLGAPWGQVLIAVDRDMAPIKVKVRKVGGGTVWREISAEDRARICAGLAVAAWRSTVTVTPANAVRAIAPAAGRDFNDELISRIAAGG